MFGIKEVKEIVDMNGWVYECNGGDSGIVFAPSYDEAAEQLKKVYRNLDSIKITDIGNYENKGTVWVTFPA